MKRFIFVFLTLSFLLSCTPQENNNNFYGYESNDSDSIETEITYGTSQVCGSSMKNAYERNFSNAQFDSICKKDKISKDLSKWHVMSLTDPETGKPLVEYMYIKTSNGEENIYRYQKISKDSIRLSKRITK